MNRRRIIYVQYTNPAAYPPLEHSSHILADAGWDVLFIGTGAKRANDLRFPDHKRIRVRLLPYHAPGWRQKLHYVMFVVWTITWLLRWRPGWIYASDLFACPVALFASFLLGIRLIYHEHDSPVEVPQSPFLRLCLWARKHLIERAVCCVIPSDKRVARLEKQLCRRATIYRIWNCPSVTEVKRTRPDVHETGVLRLLYHGSIGQSRLPDTILKAIAQLSSPLCLRIIGYETIGTLGYLNRLRELSRCLGIEACLEVVGALPTRNDVYRQSENCDIGIAFMPTRPSNFNEDSMVGASNKPFDYLACGLAVLVTDLPEWRSMYVDPGYALACNPDDPRSIAAALTWFLEHPTETRAMGERGRQRVLAEWNYEKQFAPVLSLIQSSGRVGTLRPLS